MHFEIMSCQLLGASHPDPMALPLDPAGLLPSFRPLIIHPWKKIMRTDRPSTLAFMGPFHGLSTLSPIEPLPDSSYINIERQYSICRFGFQALVSISVSQCGSSVSEVRK